MRKTYDRLCREEDEAVGYEAGMAATRRREAFVEAELPRVPTGRLDMIDRLEWLAEVQTFEEMIVSPATEAGVRSAILGAVGALRRRDPDAAALVRGLARLRTKCLLKTGLQTLAGVGPVLIC